MASRAAAGLMKMATTITVAFVLLALLCTGTTSPVVAATTTCGGIDCVDACVAPCKSFAQGICSTGACSGSCPANGVAACESAAILGCGPACFQRLLCLRIMHACWIPTTTFILSLLSQRIKVSACQQNKFACMMVHVTFSFISVIIFSSHVSWRD